MKRVKGKKAGIPKVNIKKVINLVKLCSDHPCFEFQGLLIEGDKVNTVKMYIHRNSSIKFRTWLIDTGLVLKELE